jgi:ABC-type phosphate transport system substrate-binding protein
MVALDGVEPTLENFESGKYPFSKPIYFILSKNPKPAAQRFVAALSNPAAQSVLRASGNVYVAQ